VVVAAALVLPLDLRERAMLGDGGANLLGFTVGLGAYLVLPGWAVEVVAVLAVALNVLGDTVSLSRAIDVVPPLRWFDHLGRVASTTAD
jgi:UDP-GlcNAc:undecaprenyl-phosphate GlcNAc-1-phosphate transferase